MREEANKLVAESVKARESAQTNQFELVKKAKEATEAASEAEEKVKKMEADSQKCCGCTDQNCGPQKNIKEEIKVIDQTIERQRSLWQMMKIIKKQVMEAKTTKKRVERQLSEIVVEREKLEIQYEKEKSETIKYALEQKKRIEEEVKKTLIESKSILEKVETKEKSTFKEIKEREISIIQ